jgi:fatty-acyl-CoA synthase
MDGTDQSVAELSAAQAPTSNDMAAGAVDIYHADECDTAMILYTSGTTGRAKGAMIPYRQIHWNALNTIIGLQLTQGDTAFLNMPLYHTGGWHVLFTPLMLLGGRVILQQRFDAQRCNDLVGPEGVTILFGVPTTLRMMEEAPNFSAADFSTVRFAIFGGEPCPLPVIEAYARRGVAMRQGYGLTEAGPNCFSLPAEDAIRKQGSIGFPNFHVEVCLRKDDGTEAGVGEVGELQMRGPHLCAGYWKNPAETAAAFPGGWLATGDLMTRDEDGYYYVVGRKKEMYVSGGENVYPAQVERILQSHAAVALAAVVGVPDPKWGETGWAFIKLHPQQRTSPEQLLIWCQQQLAAFQCPAKIVIMDDLPLGPSGKIDKLVLAEQVKMMAER